MKGAPIAPEVHALAHGDDARQGCGWRGDGERLGDQSGLADSGLAANNHRSRFAVRALR